jgi:hypothetical protein
LRRIQVSLTDRAQKRKAWQEIIPVQVQPSLSLVPDRSYYTTEERAYLRLELAPPLRNQSDLLARVSVPEPDGRPISQEVSLSDPVAVDLTKLPVGAHVVRAELRATLEGSYTPDHVARAEVTLRKLPPAEHTVKIGADRRLLVDDQPFFPLGFYWVAREERHYRLLAESGFNTVVYEAVPQGGVQDDFTAAEVDLDLMHQCGLKSIVDFSWSVRGPRNALEEVQRGVERLRNHPAVLAWEVVDEPHGFGGVGPEELQQAYDLIRRLDPYHPIFVNFAVAGWFAGGEGGPGGSLREGGHGGPPGEGWHGGPPLLNVLDVIGRDPYPVPREPVGTVATCVEEIRRLSGDTKPIWITLQAFAEPPTFTRPTFMQARCMTYLALLRGAHALLYFLYGYPGCPAGEPMSDVHQDLWGELPRLAKEIPALLPILAAPSVGNGRRGLQISESGVRSLENPQSAIRNPQSGNGRRAVPPVTVEAERPGLEWQAREYQGHLYLLAVNATPEPLALTWRFPPERAQAHAEAEASALQKVEILFGEAQWDLHEGAFHDVLDSYATRVYVVR